MLSEIDKRLNRLFEMHESIGKADLTGDRRSMTRWVNDGLATSCLFLRDMLGDSDVKERGTAFAASPRPEGSLNKPTARPIQWTRPSPILSM